jgi:hypothetical protein
MFILGLIIGLVVMYLICFVVECCRDIFANDSGYYELTTYFYLPIKAIGWCFAFVIIFVGERINRLINFRAGLFLRKHNCSWKTKFCDLSKLSNEERLEFCNLLICSENKRRKWMKALNVKI